MTQIYKVAHLKNNIIETLYIYGGNKIPGAEYDNDELNKLFKENPQNNIFSEILEKNQIEEIIKNNTTVEFVNDRINEDDSIETIKKKILLATNINFSFYEVYLFIKQNTKLNAVKVYQNLTQNNKLELTKIRLVEFLHNINKSELIESLEEKEIYSFNDVMNLKINDRDFLVNKSITHKFVLEDTKFPYFVNPYDATEYDDFLNQYADNIVTTTNNNLIMNFGTFDNIIYMCKADDVLSYMIDKQISELYTVKIYYPYLFDKNIKSQNMLDKNREEFLIDTNSMISDKFKLSMSNLEYLNEIYLSNNTKLTYLEKGIKTINFVIHPDIFFKLPLDIVFKLVNTSKQIPFVKYNPGKRQEKMYRLYSNKLATNGKKIPYLDKFAIFRLMKNIGKSKSVSLYIDYLFENDNIPIICDFLSNGDIVVNIEFSKPYDDVDKIIKDAINSIISNIKEYILQSGYKINTFESINDPNIEIINIDYLLKLNVKKVIDLNKILHCISNVFRVSNFDVTKGAQLRYKRVENYNEMDDQEALINDLFKQQKTSKEIIEMLQGNFNLKEKEALDKFNSFISSLQAVQNAFENHKIKTKNNPGFKTTIEKDNYNNMKINVYGIDNINYIKTISKYIEVLIEITQNSELIGKCKKIEDSELGDKVEDIVNEEIDTKPDIVNNELIYTNLGEDNDDDAEVDDDLFFGDDDSEESEDEGSDDEEREELSDEYGGGANSNDVDANYEINMDNVSLRDYFSKRMRTRDKNLFVVEGEGNINAYSRSCNTLHRRQPVILTDEEKNRIDREYAGSYDKAIKYGSSKEKEHWYICPRYWSIKHNTSLTEEQAKSGKYGNIIPLNAKKIPEGANIYEFDEKLYHRNKDGSYKTNNPGYLQPNPNNNGLCSPCCFANVTGKQQNDRRKQCKKSDDDEVEDEGENTKDKKIIKEEDYIKGPEKFPLQENRYGYLPIAIESFLKTDNKMCYISSNNTNLKLNHNCILRKGVENNKNQSFIACIADILYDDDGKKPSIVEMKERMIQSLDYDKFIKLQNGNLIRIFDDSSNDIITEDFKSSNIYIKLKSTNPEANVYFKKVIGAYNNFISFLRDDKVNIDHTYLWDLICMKDGIHHNGYNMVILDIVNDDITDKIDILCPSNTYSNNLFDDNKETFILLKNKKYFEPIYARKIDENDKYTTKKFTVNDKKILSSIKETFTMIKNSYKNCQGLSSMPNIYKFKKNIMLKKLIEKMKIKAFEITRYVFNYDGKVIAIQAKKDNKIGIIPCFPSAPIIDLDQIEYIWIHDLMGYSYNETVDFLKLVTRKIPDINCGIEIKVLEDEMIIGVITQTNQFIPINPPEASFDDGIKTISSANYIDVDKSVISDDSIDVERINYIKRIKLESSFYKIFRNIIRSMLGEYKNTELRTSIEDIINSDSIYYVDKLERIKNLLIKMTDDYFEFTDMDDDVINAIDDVRSCYKSDNCDERLYCFKDEDDCKMMIPNTRLINTGNEKNNNNNKEIYFGKIADEMVRYNRIKSFIFEPKTFISLTNIDYNLHDNEIILLESLLSNEYFDDIVQAESNKYVKKNTFDTTQPLITQKYSNELANEINLDPTKEEECNFEAGKIEGIWYKLFPEKSKYYQYTGSSNNCSYRFILTLLTMFDNTLSDITIDDLKEILLEKYKDLYSSHYDKLLKILNKQGKGKYEKLLKNNTTTVDKMILDSEYHLSNLDMLIIANNFNIPIVLFSDIDIYESLLTESETKNIYVTTKSDQYYFLFCKKNTKNIVNYKLVTLENGSPKIALSKLGSEFKNQIVNNIKPNIFDLMIKNIPSNKTTKTTKTTRKLTIT